MTATPSVLIIDDDQAFRFAMGKALSRHGFEVSEADSGEAALEPLRRAQPPDAALLDLRMRGIDGLDVLRRCPTTGTRIIVLTGHGSVGAAVEAMRLGAFSFLEKPVDAEVLVPLLLQAAADRRGRDAGLQAPPIVGESTAIAELRAFVERAAVCDDTVTLYGETGTGKEVVARNLHLHSARRDRPFVALNAATVPRELFESELFGHRKGSFTGAVSSQPGMFGRADGGSLFIDEVGELPVESQAKLLRALDTGTVRAVGAGQEIPVDVRIIAATNRDLWAEVGSGRFREDLYFRLQVLPVMLPALRERTEDLPSLCAHLLQRIGRGDVRIAPQAVPVMRDYAWPGNVRELLNVLRRSVLFVEGDEIDEALMRRMIAASVFGQGRVDRPSPPPSAPGPEAATSGADGPRASLAEVERAHIESVMREMGGNVTRAAAALGIDRRTLQRKLRTF